MSKARAKLPETLNDLTRKEWSELLEQTPLGEEDRYIARRYLLDGISQIDIAEEMEDVAGVTYHRSTISRRLPQIVGRLERTAGKLWA